MSQLPESERATLFLHFLSETEVIAIGLSGGAEALFPEGARANFGSMKLAYADQELIYRILLCCIIPNEQDTDDLTIEGVRALGSGFNQQPAAARRGMIEGLFIGYTQIMSRTGRPVQIDTGER